MNSAILHSMISSTAGKSIKTEPSIAHETVHTAVTFSVASNTIVVKTMLLNPSLNNQGASVMQPKPVQQA